MLVVLACAPAASAREFTTGTSGVDVEHFQERLAELGYLPKSGVSGTFDEGTWHAVVAFQGWQGLTVDGVASGRTRRVLRNATRPRPSSKQDGFEIHLRAQTLLIVRNGRTSRAIHVSTGSGGLTPPGRFTIYSKQVMSWSKPFKTWLPLAQYFNGGIALHQYFSVPAFPASHGCVRMPSDEADVVWRAGEVGMRIWVEEENKVFNISEATRRKERKKVAAHVLSVIAL